jgi:DNA adenine methylase
MCERWSCSELARRQASRGPRRRLVHAPHSGPEWPTVGSPSALCRPQKGCSRLEQVREDDGSRVRPILRWVGGKQALVKRLLQRLPDVPEGQTYFEPFLGAGALFFSLAPQTAVLGDANPRLIELYQSVATNPTLFARRFASLTSDVSKDAYYRVRADFNSGRSSAKRAAQFLFLNRTCFNGVFRVNRRGHFNVPYGYKSTPRFPSTEELLGMSNLLSRAKLLASSYEDTVRGAKRGDVVYLDPPYPPISDTSYFTHYTKDRFTEFDQCALADVVDDLSSRGCKILLSNADTPLVRDLYGHYRIESLDVTRWVASGKHKHRVAELVVSNF